MITDEPDYAEANHGTIELKLLNVVLKVLNWGEVQFLFWVGSDLIFSLLVSLCIVLEVKEFSIAVVYQFYEGVFR